MALLRPNQPANHVLSDHVRKGRVYSTPLVASGVLEIGDWVRDDMPDLLWPALALSELGDSAVRRFVDWQRIVLADLEGLADAGFLAECLDGRLTGLERLGTTVPAAIENVRRRALEQGLLPAGVSRALASYFYRPAEWLVDIAPRPPEQEDIDLLARAVFGVLKDAHRESLIKCMYVWAAVLAGTFRSDQETIDLLQPYPTDAANRDAADTAVRAMWGAHRGLLMHENPNHFDPSIQWARVFWGANSMTTRCIRSRDLENSEREPEEDAMPIAEEPSEAGSVPEPAKMPADGAHLRRLALDLISSYAEALESAPADLHAPEPQEVNAGLVLRAGRDVATALATPDLWCSEHGSHITRMLAETRIYIQWMANQDASIYQRYKDYGAGKAKLYARILNELPADARTVDFETGRAQLHALSNTDDVIDYRVVDTGDSFSGKSIRKMAEEAGLLDFYRQVYQMASGVTHSEWWSIESDAMERCQNPLHQGHLIPSLSLNAGGHVELATAWVQQLHTLIRLSLRVLNTDEAAVQNAFAWLDDADDVDRAVDTVE